MRRVRWGVSALALWLGACFPSLAQPPATQPPAPVAYVSTTPQQLAGGAQQLWSVRVDQAKAMAAVFQGGMWLPDPGGKSIYAKYVRHMLHSDGSWTWIGKVATRYGEQSVVLTFGKNAVYGYIPQDTGMPLRLVTHRGQVGLLQTDATLLARSREWRALRSVRDNPVPVRVPSAATRSRAAAAPATTVTGPVTIDVMVVYTPGFVTEHGSQSAALTRIQNLVDITNQAYIDSGVNQRIRLVHTMEVNYPDASTNDSALTDITGSNGTVPAALQAVAPARTQYGADLVALVRSFSNSAQGNCGEGWMNGGGQVSIDPAQDAMYGYSVSSDGSDTAGTNYYCADTTFAHELGHNMGNDHDRATAKGDSGGAYPYSYGYLGTGTSGFTTIMGYSTSTNPWIAKFSNPSIATCMGAPCGIADAAADSADNAHSMNNTAPLIAQFEPSMVKAGGVHNDVTGSGHSALLWYDAAAGQFVYWAMDGASTNATRSFPVPAGYQPAATGDFNGNGYAGIVWMDAAGNTYLWSADGNGAFVSSQVAKSMPGWKVLGAVDIDGDGRADLLWYNAATGQMTYWLMDGATMKQWKEQDTNPGLRLLATGDFDGNGHGDMLWELPNGAMYMWLSDGNGGFASHYLAAYPTGWLFAGAQSLDASGNTDLLWYNPDTGRLTYWLMNGASVSSWQSIWTSTGLTPLAVGSFDGSNAGLVWQTSGNALYMWLFNRSNPSTFSYYSLGPPPAGYTALP